MIKSEKGMSLIEVLIALAILGLVAAAFLSGLTTASKALIIADERTTAESLARTQMESVKQQPYEFADDYNPEDLGSGEVTYEKIDEIPDGYSIWSVNRAGDTVEDIIYGVPWDSQANQPSTTDVGLQKIRLVVKHYGEVVLIFVDEDDRKITLEGYKVNR